MKNILLLGPLWGNAKHGAEVGVYDALVELGHNVSVWDHRVGKYRMDGQDIPADKSTKHLDIFADIENIDVVLCLGPGLTPELIASPIFKATKNCLRILWNSEPIRLDNYRQKVKENKKHFSVICTFDESEIPLYKSMGISALFLPQAFNPSWYKPIKLPKSQRFPNALCFIGSVGGKWAHRQLMLQRVANCGITLHLTTLFDAEKVNQAYNMHDGVLNLGLWCEECGPGKDLKGFGLQQRIFESIGAGKICITNEIPSGTNKIFKDKKHVLYYNKNNLEEVCRLALDKKFRLSMEEEILKIRGKHTYKARLKSLIDMINW